MSKASPNPTPGKWLHDAILGALTGRGMSLAAWCRKNEINAGSIRPYTHGINSSDESKKVLEKLIDDAGRETVLAMYSHRLLQQAREFERWAA